MKKIPPVAENILAALATVESLLKVNPPAGEAEHWPAHQIVSEAAGHLRYYAEQATAAQLGEPTDPLDVEPWGVLPA